MFVVFSSIGFPVDMATTSWFHGTWLGFRVKIPKQGVSSLSKRGLLVIGCVKLVNNRVSWKKRLAMLRAAEARRKIPAGPDRLIR